MFGCSFKEIPKIVNNACRSAARVYGSSLTTQTQHQRASCLVSVSCVQFKEFLGTYNKVTENCFMDCVRDFTTRDVKPEESSCSESCLQKYLKMTQRISMRFQEYHIQQNEALAAKAGLLGQPR
uniref:Mitochondrial import inner membrane translocase subunit n=1 Tax=Pundamilia nyererei TaxID=303518 RepID=A0A3B4F2N5_9CICH